MTITKNEFCNLIVKKSNFIAFSFIVNSKKQINEILDKLNKEHKDAKHICYAYCFYDENNILNESYFESSEPNGTSGKQIYNFIKKNNLVNILVVIIRYFGNTKLGIGLLSRTYLESTKNVIKRSEITKFIIRKEIQIKFKPNKFNYVMNYIKENNILIKNRNNLDLEFTLLIPIDLEIKDFLNNIY